MSRSELLDAAVHYAELGYNVFPCYSPCTCQIFSKPHCDCHVAGCTSVGKHPRTKHGLKDATQNVKQITDWWTNWWNANIGIALSHEVAVDIDPRHGGAAVRDMWETDHGPMNPGAEAETGGGGWHLLYDSAGLQIGNMVNVAPGIDLRASGGYIIAPPSKHISGREYRWVKELNGHLAPPPDWLAAILQKKPPPAAVSDRPGSVDFIPDGQRDVTLTSMAGTMRRRGMPMEAIRLALLETNKQLCRPPLPESQVNKIAASIGRKAPGEALGTIEEGILPVPKKLAALMEMELGEADFVIEGILSKGLAILGGRPKSGKSFLALDWCIGVALGGAVLGKIRVPPGDVLYLALEDNERRLQKRARSQLNGTRAPEWFDYYTTWPQHRQGGTQAIRNWLIAHPQARLVVIDTLVKFRSPLPERGGASIYQEDYAFIAEIKALADEFDVCILFLHHVRKPGAMRSEDPVDTLSGTAGISGAADTLLILKRTEKNLAALHVTGRDVEEETYAIQFDLSTLQWVLIGTTDALTMSLERRQVLEVLKQSDHAMTPSQIAPLVDKSPSATKKLLWAMKQDGQVWSTGSGSYVMPGKPPTGGMKDDDF